jgi:D-serine deaminase-like pyridoxal phosphate-dependent protein
MKLYDLSTPFVAINLDKLKSNIRKFGERARENGKVLFPMVKTHKSSRIALMQREAGAEGFTTGTVDEAITLVKAGIKEPILMGYPVSDSENIRRLIDLVKMGGRLILRFDTYKNAKFINSILEKEDLTMGYTIKVDVGGRRFGVRPDDVGKFAKRLEEFKNLEFTGIVTHPANAYYAKNPGEVRMVATGASKQMRRAIKSLKEHRIQPEIVGIGSTPTFRFDVEENIYTHLFPGNYVYFDRQQALVFGSANLNNCALTVCTSVLSIHERSEGKIGFINAGSLFFDRRKVGNSYGGGLEKKVEVIDLSQEVSKIRFEDNVKLGEKINIIPNHSCIANNAVNYLVLHKNGFVKDLIEIDGKRRESK